MRGLPVGLAQRHAVTLVRGAALVLAASLSAVIWTLGGGAAAAYLLGLALAVLAANVPEGVEHAARIEGRQESAASLLAHDHLLGHQLEQRAASRLPTLEAARRSSNRDARRLPKAQLRGEAKLRISWKGLASGGACRARRTRR